MSGLFLLYLTSKGTSSIGLQMISLVADKNIKGVAIAMLMLITTVVSSCATMMLGILADKFGYKPTDETKGHYGNLVAGTTIIPSLLAIPCYLFAGLKYK